MDTVTSLILVWMLSVLVVPGMCWYMFKIGRVWLASFPGLVWLAGVALAIATSVLALIPKAASMAAEAGAPTVTSLWMYSMVLMGFIAPVWVLINLAILPKRESEQQA